MITEAHQLLARTLEAGNKDMFKYMLHHMTYASRYPDYVHGQSVCRFGQFILPNEGMVEWLSEEQLKKILDRADELKHTLCGNRPPNITLPDLNQDEWVQLYDVEAKYTLIYRIWESTCGHCKKRCRSLSAFMTNGNLEVLRFLRLAMTLNLVLGKTICVSMNTRIGSM